MATVKEFEGVMGPLKQAVLEDHMEVSMEVRNEKVSEITYKEWGLDKFTNEKKFQITVNCHPGKDERYGNRYSGFFAESKVDKLFAGLSRDDFKDKAVMVGFEWREYQKDGETRKARELKWIKLADVDVNEDVGVEPTPEQPVLDDLSPPSGTSTEKQPPAHTQGRVAPQMSSKDVSIVRQVSHKASVILTSACVASGELTGEMAIINFEVRLAHAIEQDINR